MRAAVGVGLEQERTEAEQGGAHPDAAVAALNAGRKHRGVHRQSLGVDEDVALPALRARPPFLRALDAPAVDDRRRRARRPPRLAGGIDGSIAAGTDVRDQRVSQRGGHRPARRKCGCTKTWSILSPMPAVTGGSAGRSRSPIIAPSQPPSRDERAYAVPLPPVAP